MKSVIAKWIGYFERRPGLVVLGWWLSRQPGSR